MRLNGIKPAVGYKHARKRVGRGIVPAVVWLPGNPCEDIQCTPAAGMEYAVRGGLEGGGRRRVVDVGAHWGPPTTSQVRHHRHIRILCEKE